MTAATRTLPDNMHLLTKAQHDAAHGIERKPARGRRRNAMAWSAVASEFIASHNAAETDRYRAECALADRMGAR